MSKPMSAGEFLSMVAEAKPGTRICYYTGNLASDAQRDLQTMSFRKTRPSNANPLCNLANAALDASDEGCVHLFQEQIAGGYKYLAIVRPFGNRTRARLGVLQCKTAQAA